MARDIIHDAVKNALIKEGWTITADPYRVEYEEIAVYADLAAERLIAAERSNEKIAVEIKSFVGRSAIREMETAVGQYAIYRAFLRELEPDRKLYLAINDSIYEQFFRLKAIQLILESYQLHVLVVKVEAEEIALWTS